MSPAVVEVADALSCGGRKAVEFAVGGGPRAEPVEVLRDQRALRIVQLQRDEDHALGQIRFEVQMQDGCGGVGVHILAFGGLEEQRVGQRVDLGADGQAGVRGGRCVDDIDAVVGQVELDVQRLAGLLDAVEGGLGVVVGAEDLPHGAGPRGLGHPQQAAAVGRPQVGVHALEDGAVIDVVEHLGLALEVFEAGGRAELGLNLGHEGGDIAVPALVPVVIGPDVVDGPLVGFGDGALEGFQRGHGGRAGLHREAAVERGEVLRGNLVAIRPAARQIHRVGAGRVVARAVERADQLVEAEVDDGLGHAFVAAAPHDDGRVVAEALDGVGGVGEEERGSSASML